MARPKMTVRAALGSDKAQATEQDVMRSGVTVVGAEQPATLETGRVVHMREKKVILQDDRSGVDDCEVEYNEEDAARFRTYFKQPPPQPPRRLGSSSEYLQRTEAVFALPASHQKLACGDEEHNPGNCRTTLGTQNIVKREGKAEAEFVGTELTPGYITMPLSIVKREDAAKADFMCTACGLSIAIEKVRAHPVLNVGVCGACYKFLFSSPFTKDNALDPSENENECRWCGDGGELVCCDTCPKTFCKICIKRNFGADILHAIESTSRQWRCFICNDNLLQTLIRDYKNVESLVKTMKKNRGRGPKRRKFREYMPRLNTRNRSWISNKRFPNDTVASIIAREKEALMRKHPGKHFTAFEMARRLRPRQNRHSLFTRGNLKLTPRLTLAPAHGTVQVQESIEGRQQSILVDVPIAILKKKSEQEVEYA